MKSNDTIKIVVAVVLLVVAGIFIVMQFGGGGSGPQGGEPVQNYEFVEEETEGETLSPYRDPSAGD